MMGKLNMDPIDNVSRDSKDGTYRCPRCQTPFTRRSNLRRHFQIHLRGSSLKCEVCNEEHSTKDGLQDHVTISHSTTWHVSHEKPHQRIVIPQDTPSSIPHSPFSNVSPPSFNPFSSENTSMGQYSSLESPAPACAFQIPNFDRVNLSSSVSSRAASTAAILPRSTSFLASDRNIAMPGSSPRINPFTHRCPNTSSPSINSSPIASSSPYTRLGQPGSHQGYYGLYPPSEVPPLPSHQEWIAEILGQQILGLNGDEPPIYTRQQVKDMLDVVSDCFTESVESVLNSDQRRPNPARSDIYSTALDTGVRQMILNEAIPRLVSRLQGSDNLDVMSGGLQGY